MAEIDLRPDHLAVVKAILKAEIPDRDVWAFGSRAKWTARDASDLDLVIRGERPLSLGKLARLRRAFEESYLPFEVDLVDWHTLAGDFQSVILAQKVELQRSCGAHGQRQGSASWRSVPLSECADFLSGGTPSRANPEYWNGDIPWATAKDMKQLRLYDTEDHLTQQAIAEGARVVPADTVLVLVRGMTLHDDLPICITRREMVFNQDVRALRPRPEVDGDFLAYALLANKNSLLSLVDAASHGTGRIHSGALASFPIALPSLEEQQAIGDILGTLDDKIELNSRMDQTLEAMARAIFKSWFVDFDPVREKHSLFPIRLGSSDLGDIPEGWTVQAIGDVVTILGGSTPSTVEKGFWNGPYAFATPRDLARLVVPILQKTERTISQEGLSQVSSGLLPQGTVLLSSRAPIGYLAISDIPLSVNQGFIAMVCDRQLPNYYVYQWARQNMETIIGRANGTTFLEISKRNFRPIQAIVPTQGVLNRYVELVSPMFGRIAANLGEADTLAALRDALLPKLLSGEIRIKEAEKLVGEVA